MPELPEVETIHSGLLRLLTESEQPVSNWDLTVDWHYIRTKIVSAPIVRMQRKGKNLAWYTKDFSVILHLRMTGRLTVLYVDSPIDSILGSFKHVRAVFSFSNSVLSASFRLIFTDTRGFGICEVNEGADPNRDYWKFRNLGPDPTNPEEWSYEIFRNIIAKTGINRIGTVLMRQELIAGIGNIYRSEILFDAGILPFRRPDTLTETEISKLFDSINRVLAAGIKAGGCSISDYRDIFTNKGSFQKQLMVYQRDGKYCLNCGTGVIQTADIEKMRRAFWCPNCQE